MSMKQQIQTELHRLGAVSAQAGGATLVLDASDGRLTARLTAVDQLACAFEELTWHAPRLDQADLAQLDRIATALSKRLSYLLESISPVEKDQDGCVVQMRSNPPHKDDDGTSYYELVVRRGELSLCRYAKVSGQARRTIPAHVTREVFCRLADDLAAVAQE